MRAAHGNNRVRSASKSAPEAAPKCSIAIAGSRWFQTVHSFQRCGSGTSGSILSARASTTPPRSTWKRVRQ
jgi:hypothetical protein